MFHSLTNQMHEFLRFDILFVDRNWKRYRFNAWLACIYPINRNWYWEKVAFHKSTYFNVYATIKNHARNWADSVLNTIKRCDALMHTPAHCMNYDSQLYIIWLMNDSFLSTNKKQILVFQSTNDISTVAEKTSVTPIIAHTLYSFPKLIFRLFESTQKEAKENISNNNSECYVISLKRE